MTEFKEWTRQDVRAVILEAAETLSRLPEGKARPFFNGLWREYVAPKRSKRLKPSKAPTGAAIDRMNRAWDWINDIPDEETRRFLYDWSLMKAVKRLTYAEISKFYGLCERGLTKRIDKHCQSIADSLNQSFNIREQSALATSTGIETETQSQTVHSKSYAKNWMAPNAKPRNIPSLHEKITTALPEGVTE